MGKFLNRRRPLSKGAYIHLKGSFVAGTPKEECYVWINGVQYPLDE